MGYFLSRLAEEVDEAAVLSEHRHGWLLHPKNGGASPIQILGEADDLWDLTIAFGRGDARIELGFSEKVNPDDELRQLEDICRAIVAGRLSEKRKRKGQSRWQITLMNGKSAPRVCELGLPSDALDSNE